MALSGPRNPYPGKLGVVEEGALADLLLVDGDPLANISRHFAAILAAGVFATIASSVSGVATGALLATINEAVHTQGEALVGILAAFAGLGVVSLASEFAGNIGNSLVGQRILTTLRKELSAKILRAPIAEIERFQSHRLIAILAQDVATIGGFTLNFSAVAIAFAIAVGCFATGRGTRRYRDGEAELAHAALCARA